jgi:DNA-binding HxlR family transcriptional regulator
MALEVLDEDGVPLAGVERKLAHHFLGRENPLAKRVVYALIGGPRRNAGLVPLLEGGNPNNLTHTLRLLQATHMIVPMVDARTKPAAKAYRLSTFGLLVADWMRRYEFLDELEELHRHPSVASPA